MRITRHLFSTIRLFIVIYTFYVTDMKNAPTSASEAQTENVIFQ